MTLTSRLYAILDAETCARRRFELLVVAKAWRDAGILLLQYRDKAGTDPEVLRNARKICDIFAGSGATLIMNDRTHLLPHTGFHGLHLGQTDGSVQLAVAQGAAVGISTHSPEQLLRAESGPASYIAIGPVYATSTKLDADPVVGLEGVRTARALTAKPLVAIGGITRANALDVLAAGADAVAVISALLPTAGASPQQIRDTARDFLLALQ